MYHFIEKLKELFGFGKNRLNAVIIRWRRPNRPQRPGTSPHPVPPANQVPIEHVLNDPVTPELVKTSTPPVPPIQSPFVVKDYAGGGFQHGSVEYQAANAYYTVGETLNLYNQHTEKPIPHWHRTETLVVLPRAGVDLNAFYDGRSLQFFYASDPRFGTVYAVDSADIVSHETGHSILDCYRPDMWNAAALEVGAFHESFGDITAIFHALSHEEMLAKAIEETGGDLRKTNVIARLAEQFGAAIFKLDPNGRNPDYLRCAVNDFKYVNPGTLPDNAPDNQLCAEVHSFSRVFTGAFYDILVMMYEAHRNDGNNPMESIVKARDLMAKYTMKSIQNAPLNANFFESMAKTFLWADVTLTNRKYHDRMHQIFMNRNILGPVLAMTVAPKCQTNDRIVKNEKKLVFKLSDVLLTAQNDNPLYNVEIEVPMEEAMLYDNDRNFVQSISVSHERSVEAAQDMINHLHRTGKVSDDPRTPFEIRNGKLVRTFFDCRHCG